MPEPASRSGYIMGFDFGFRRIGVAVGQTTTHTASCLETVSHGQQPDWAAIDRLVGDWKPAVLVVGLPLGADGEETDMSRAARHFGETLRSRYHLDVEYADERLTSQAAGSRFAEQRSSGNLRRKDAGKLDAMAARIILENWLQDD
ncbi:MAG: Holliday junction resolvase RuvX [Xanthomonadales bacterium]|nr:Holliday junction resolvase RuvX [Gammaproteobacteria bacterium]MBT8054287.1 Holliday junction resolvase RuvX [Gammaproteobacteria bacterium]NND57520.1 Holliday junction resolvase RuvX [Xanthomonadales bacterium]NNK51244.1 Holliday junction resolvase RuvX [Xanthomonadales bacterium]